MTTINLDDLDRSILRHLQLDGRMSNLDLSRAVARTRTALAALPEVLECHHVTGQYDDLLKVVLSDRRALERFVVEKLTPLPGIARIQTSVVLAAVKATPALPI